MYSKSSNIIVSNLHLSNYLDGFDVYNSKLLYKLSNPYIEKTLYEINMYEYRPDLIALDFYGSTSYLPYVLISSGMSLDCFKKGTVIKLIPRSVLDNIIKSM